MREPMSDPMSSGEGMPVRDPSSLGFIGNEATGWTRQIRGQSVAFRLLRTLDELMHAEHMQEEVFQVSERDLVPANELIAVPETGGTVIAAFLPGDPERAAAVLVGWGGFVGRPRVVSDFLAVRTGARNLGLAAELKRLQAAVALDRGFAEIVWTVDPLRAANARLNFGKLGAVARQYEIDRYGSGFAAGLYGGMPTDRLHVTWEITAPRVQAHLLGRAPRRDPGAASQLPSYEPGTGDHTVRVAMPSDVDALLVSEPAKALDWRLRMRDALHQAFGEGFAITGFLPAIEGQGPWYMLERE
jgi:predicted GNAT superfamily acetyltransferase